MHPVNSGAYHGEDGKMIDALISDYYTDKDKGHLVDMISIIHRYERISKDPLPLMEGVESYLKENLKGEVTLLSLADHLDASSHYISFLFEDRTGATISDHLREMRLMKAKLLLTESEKSISQIGLECGLGAREEFQKEFLYFEGLTPTQYRKYHKK